MGTAIPRRGKSASVQSVNSSLHSLKPKKGSVLFTKIEDTQVILKKRGKYHQVDLYHRQSRVYAFYQGGYILLLRHGTSIPSVSIDGFFSFEPTYDGLGVVRYE